MDEVVRNCQKLQSFTNNLLKEFADCVKQNNRIISLERIIRLLIGFGNNNGCQHFEV